jgi:hypothetical protein
MDIDIADLYIALLFLSPLLVIIFIFIIYNFVKGRKKLGLIALGVGLFFICINYSEINYNSRTELFTYTDNKKHIMSLKETKESSAGTKVKLETVFMDIDNICFSFGIKGKEKVVGIEIKENLQDNEALAKLETISKGNRFTYKYLSTWKRYKPEKFVDPLYLVFNLDNGEEISFNVEDKNNFKQNSKVVKINKELDIDGKKLIITEVICSHADTRICTTSEYEGFDIKAYVVKEGISDEVRTTSGLSGDKPHFDFEVWTRPINEPGEKIMIVPAGSDKKFIIDLKE